MKKRIALVLMIAGIACWVATGSVDAAHSDHGCGNCHVPHNAGDTDDPANSYGVPLWSMAQLGDGIPFFDVLYDSPTLDADVQQPNGATKLCLGCHDGSYLYGRDHDREISEDRQFTNEKNSLASTHPVSFLYDADLVARDGGLKPTDTALTIGGTIASKLLDANGKMQCSSCHDVHTSGHGETLLRWEEADEVMCRSCHNK